MKNIFLFLIVLLFSHLANAQKIPVLIYHHVTGSIDPGETVISLEKFAEHLDILEKNGYSTATISQLADHMSGKNLLPEKTVVLTFDDGFSNNLDAAAELNKRNMSATFYIVTDVSKLYMPERYMSKEQIKELSKNPKFEIGAHSHTHFMKWINSLDTIPNSVIVGEAFMSKNILESIIDMPVNSFSWPFGYVRNSLISYMKDMGFSNTVIVSENSENDDNISKYFIQRITVDGRCPASDILTMIESKKSVSCR